VDVSSAAANLASISTADPEWKKAKMEFLRLYLYYGPLAMVGDYQHELKEGEAPRITVQRAMIAFNSCLQDQSCVGSMEMTDLSLAVAHTCRGSLASSWGLEISQLQGDYQKL
jgi:hypothetical protein